MQTKGIVIQNTKIPFALVWSQYEDLRNAASRTAYLEACQPLFQDLPIVLVSEDGLGNLIYLGDEELVNWLEGQKHLSIQWEHYSI